MAEMISEPTGAVLNGTDAATPVGKESVEVVLDQRGGDASAAVRESADRPRPLSQVLARLRAKESGTAAPAKQPAAAATAEPEATVEEQPAEAAGEDPAEAAPVEGEDHEQAPEAAPPDPPDVAALRAEAEAAKHESVGLRARLAQLEAGTASDDERIAYITDPTAVVRATIARHLRVKADDPVIDKELAWLQRDWTVRAIGDSNLPEDRRSQHAREQSDRRWDLDQQARAADRQSAQEREQRTQAVQFVASHFEGSKAELTNAQLVAAVDGVDPAAHAYDLIPEAVRQGLIDPNAPPAEIAKSALRIANQVLKKRADQIRAHIAAPAQAPAPATAAATGSRPAAPKPASSTVAPAKSAPAAPRTLSAKQAASAPVARPTAPRKPTIVEIDPNDRDTRNNRAREIAERRFKSQK